MTRWRVRIRAYRWFLAGLALTTLWAAWSLRSSRSRHGAASADTHEIRAAFLDSLGLAYPIVATTVAALTGVAMATLPSRRRVPAQVRRAVMHTVLAGTTTLLGLVLAEAVAGAYLSWAHRVPRLAMAARGPRPPDATDDVTIV